MTPRQMWVAHLAACMLTHDAYDDVAAHGGAAVSDGADWSVFASREWTAPRLDLARCRSRAVLSLRTV